MGALEESLARGKAAMMGQGVDPSAIYGAPPPTTPPVGAWATPSPAMAGGAPPSPASPPYGIPSEALGASGTSMPTKMPLHGSVPDPAAAGVQTPGQATSPMAGLGPNGFGVHPDINLHQIADYLLPKLRDVESKGDYTADRSKTNPGQTASGAYQYIDSTWNNYGGYKRAVDAPQEIQDKKAREDLLGNLQKYNGNPFAAVAAHYFPHYAGDPSLWNKPLRSAGGQPVPGSTVNSYVSKVLPANRVAQYLQSLTSSGGGQ